jgi:hypothetical protein
LAKSWDDSAVAPVITTPKLVYRRSLLFQLGRRTMVSPS